MNTSKLTFTLIFTHEMCLKSVETEAIFIKTEMNKE